jgi:D-lactate dehydrogenase
LGKARAASRQKALWRGLLARVRASALNGIGVEKIARVNAEPPAIGRRARESLASFPPKCSYREKEESQMKIYFVEVEASERRFFESELANHELHFVSNLEEVEGDAEVVSTFIYSRIDGPFLDRHPAVKLIATRSTTHDHLELESCAKRNVTMCIVPSYGDHVVAEHTFALLLAVARRLRESMNLSDDSHFSYAALRGFELRSKTFGIIGTGRIGRRTVPIATGFGMNVIAYDIRPKPELAGELGFRYVSFEELLAGSDIISLHASLNSSSYHILNAEAFAKCRLGVVIINTARGKLIDTDALIEALDQGIVGGAGLDVLGEESVMRRRAERIISDQIIQRIREPIERTRVAARDPIRAKEIEKLMRLGGLLLRPEVVCTPHTAFNCVEAIERINRVTVENIKAFVAGTPINTLSPGTAPETAETPAAAER